MRQKPKPADLSATEVALDWISDDEVNDVVCAMRDAAVDTPPHVLSAAVCVLLAETIHNNPPAVVAKQCRNFAEIVEQLVAIAGIRADLEKQR